MQAKEDEVYELKQACEDLQDDIAGFEKKERELLSFSEKLASSNAELQTSKTSLEKKVTAHCACLWTCNFVCWSIGVVHDCIYTQWCTYMCMYVCCWSMVNSLCMD